MEKLHRLVNGIKVELSEEEEAVVRSEWELNENKKALELAAQEELAAIEALEKKEALRLEILAMKEEGLI